MGATETGKRAALQFALLEALQAAYRAPDDRSGNPVEMPVADAAAALLNVLANVLASSPNKGLRDGIIGRASPILERAVAEARARHGRVVFPAASVITLPH